MDKTDQEFLRFNLDGLRANLTLNVGKLSDIDPDVTIDHVTVFP